MAIVLSLPEIINRNFVISGIDEDDMPTEEAAAEEEMPPLEEDDDSAKMEEVD